MPAEFLEDELTAAEARATVSQDISSDSAGSVFLTSLYIKIESSLIAAWVKLLVRPYMHFNFNPNHPISDC